MGAKNEDGQEIVLANVEGPIYALQKHCGHAEHLIRRNINGTTLICPMHFVHRNLMLMIEEDQRAVEGGPEMQELAGLMDQLSESARITLGRTVELSQKIKTYNLKIFPVQWTGIMYKLICNEKENSFNFLHLFNSLSKELII